MLDPLEQLKAQPQLADLPAPLFEWVEQQALRIKALETERYEPNCVWVVPCAQDQHRRSEERVNEWC